MKRRFAVVNQDQDTDYPDLFAKLLAQRYGLQLVSSGTRDYVFERDAVIRAMQSFFINDLGICLDKVPVDFASLSIPTLRKTVVSEYVMHDRGSPSLRFTAEISDDNNVFVLGSDFFKHMKLPVVGGFFEVESTSGKTTLYDSVVNDIAKFVKRTLPIIWIWVWSEGKAIRVRNPKPY